MLGLATVFGWGFLPTLCLAGIGLPEHDGSRRVEADNRTSECSDAFGQLVGEGALSCPADAIDADPSG